LLQGDQPVDTVDLLRVVLDHAAQALQAAENARLGHLVGVEKTLVAGEQEPRMPVSMSIDSLTVSLALPITRSVCSTHCMADSR
jgi:hypothetical protein